MKKSERVNSTFFLISVQGNRCWRLCHDRGLTGDFKANPQADF